jgi:hypothetical protein
MRGRNEPVYLDSLAFEHHQKRIEFVLAAFLIAVIRSSPLTSSSLPTVAPASHQGLYFKITPCGLFEPPNTRLGFLSKGWEWLAAMPSL